MERRRREQRTFEGLDLHLALPRAGHRGPAPSDCDRCSCPLGATRRPRLIEWSGSGVHRGERCADELYDRTRQVGGSGVLSALLCSPHTHSNQVVRTATATQRYRLLPWSWIRRDAMQHPWCCILLPTWSLTVAAPAARGSCHVDLLLPQQLEDPAMWTCLRQRGGGGRPTRPGAALGPPPGQRTAPKCAVVSPR